MENIEKENNMTLWQISQEYLIYGTISTKEAFRLLDNLGYTRQERKRIHKGWMRSLQLAG